jgi:hypothetical protein
MMARDILAIQGAGVGIEREFSIAGNFNLDNRTYSSDLLSALMVCNHAQNEENRAIRFHYYLACRMEPIEADDMEAEEEEDAAQQQAVIGQLVTIDISDDEDDYELDSELSDVDSQMLANEEVEEETTTAVGSSIACGTPARGTPVRVLPARAEVFRRSSARITPATMSVRGRPTRKRSRLNMQDSD